MGALEDIAAERKRQIEVEGWSRDHDGGHTDGSLAAAGACYAIGKSAVSNIEGHIVRLWPWGDEWWKPSDVRRNLVKAGALILAEIERLDRIANNESKGAAPAASNSHDQIDAVIAYFTVNPTPISNRLISICEELRTLRRSLLREEVGEGSLAMTPASSTASTGRPPVAKTTA